MTRTATGDLVEDFIEQWRDPAYNCFSSGHKFRREVCPVTQVANVPDVNGQLQLVADRVMPAFA
ncbi:MAG: hypothetical protein H0U61_14615 [Nocardioidaceae bacterium]|nr:hypothetical protein [Nocardioidaceae bacterium]